MCLGRPGPAQGVRVEPGHRTVVEDRGGVHDAACGRALPGGGEQPFGRARFGDVTEHDLDPGARGDEFVDRRGGHRARCRPSIKDDLPRAATRSAVGSAASAPSVSRSSQLTRSAGCSNDSTRTSPRNAIAAFWFAYIVTRPLGASFADWFAAPTGTTGGLGWGTGPITAVLTVAIIGLVGYLSTRSVS
ncbi:MAG: rane protein [Amycolatopsis sp.]|jgi:hypothetical protein|nr:rane protein [Amycolatopsis sp.]